jgi:group I intron endonuclease
MFYCLYEIRNNLNGKVYIGVHKTKNKTDGYMGSGKVIKQAIQKYGLSSFSKRVLEEFDTQEEMYNREKELITPDFIERVDVYNLRVGGFGGFDWINNNCIIKFAGKIHSDKTKSLIASLARARTASEETRKKMKLAQSKFNLNTEKGQVRSEKLSKSLKGRKLTLEHKANISEALKITHRKCSPELVDKIKNLRCMGESSYSIASTLGIARNTVMKYW